jgi:peptidoglycan hydrolase FlgJ
MVELGSITNTAAASGGGQTGAVRPPDDPAKVKEAATQFEALLIGQMLKSMREAGAGGWMDSGEDQAGTSMMEMGEERMAEMMAQQGGLGLANMVMRGLASASGGDAPETSGVER